MAGEPYGKSVAEALQIMQHYKSASGIPLLPGDPAPTAIQSGWTDTFFPVSEALHYADRSRATHSRSPQLLLFADVGHGWASDKTADSDYTVNEGLDFLDAIMLTHSTPRPASSPSLRPARRRRPPVHHVTLRPWAGSRRGRSAWEDRPRRSATSSGGDLAVSAALNPAYAGKAPVQLNEHTVAPGTADYETPVGSNPTTMLGGCHPPTNEGFRRLPRTRRAPLGRLGERHDLPDRRPRGVPTSS